MSHRTIQLSFFLVTALILAVMIFFILKPFLAVIFLSSVLAITFYPLYLRLLKKFKDRKGLASMLTVVAIVLFIIIPVTLLSAAILQESVDLYNKLAFEGGSAGLATLVQNVLLKAENAFPIKNVGEAFNVEQYTRSLLNWIIGQTDNVLAVIFGGLFKFILMLLTIFYMLVNGERIKKIILKWSPLPDSYDTEFIATLSRSVDAVIRGRILVSIGQGAMMGIGFAIFGVDSPVLWGFVGAILSLVPIVGTSILSVPAVAYLFFIGDIGSAIGLLIWSALCVGLIDNFLSFIFFKDRIRVHPLLVLFSILGGVEVFGVIGFLVGPVVVSAFVALAKIYPFIVPTQKQIQSEIE